MDGTKSIVESIIASGAEIELDEGLGAIAASKLRDLAGMLFLRPRPIVVLTNPLLGKTIIFKLRRGALMHSLYRNDGGNDQLIDTSRSVARLMLRLIGIIGRHTAQGYLEV